MTENISDHLIIAASEQTAQKLTDMLAQAGIEPGLVVKTGGEVREAAADGGLILLGWKFPDAQGLELAGELPEEADILLIAPRDFEGETPENVLVIKNPVSPDALVQAVRTLAHCRVQTKALRGEVKRLKKTLEERKIVERAKGRLMDTLHLSESEAHYKIQKQSMDTGRRIVEVAMEILSADGEEKKE